MQEPGKVHPPHDLELTPRKRQDPSAPWVRDLTGGEMPALGTDRGDCWRVTLGQSLRCWKVGLLWLLLLCVGGKGLIQLL